MHLRSSLCAWILGLPVLVYPRVLHKSQDNFLIQNNFFEHSQQIIDIQPQFESPEHTSIGDQILLKYSNSTVSGSNFNYEVKDSILSFGDIIALAADFYYRWRVGECHPSISDDWDINPSRSLDIAAENVNLLRTDSPDILNCVRPLIQQQRAETKDARSRGQDIAQAYHNIEDKYNKKFTLCGLGYVVIALCNPDHFGNDAKKAYSSVHTLALKKAQEGHKSKKESDLKEAYFIEGFAQHYLTDMFAAGHIRTPRRLLHSISFTPDLYPGDRCCKAQHDEDGANGLWVTNEEGYSWAAYGDKHLGQGRSGKNLQMVTAASQAGVDEIWDTFQSGRMAEPTEFMALKKAPVPEKAFGITNSVPLFEKNPNGEANMLFRQNIDQRAISKSRQIIKDTPSNDEWAVYYNAISASGSSKNMYVYSKSFVSDQRFLHLGKIESGGSGLVSNIYGAVDAGKFGQYWSMAAQGLGNLTASGKKRLWINAQSVNSGVISLVAREYTSGGKTNALHVGYGFTENSNGKLNPQVLWSQTVDDGNSDRRPGEIIYGSFSEDSSKRIMVKYYEGSKADSRLEFWSLPETLNEPPTQLTSPLNTAKLNFLVSHQMDHKDSFATIVGYQSGPLSISTGTWYFCSWASDYGRMKLSTIPEPNSIPAQALLSDPLSNRLVRLYYGKRYSTVQTLRIDVLLPKRNSSDGSIVFQTAQISQKFPITWQAFDEEDYLLWIMHDVNGNGHADLVGYTSDASNLILNVVVFPSLADGTFDVPIVSRIQLDPQTGSLLTAEFMQPLYTTQASFTYTDTGDRSSGAIMSFFDNYGIIASRLIAPEASRGTYKYELKGQDSAIAGQRSHTLGERPREWMGLRKKTQSIGIIPLI
ncbi:hypothetical protein HJFPF1_00259 [Paramyrothecium foliicola]|nr:hypothetical protein HJFPF1_00259 [Paramyrothecium foliicola]